MVPVVSCAEIDGHQPVCLASLHMLHGPACRQSTAGCSVSILSASIVQVAQYEKVKREAARLAAEVERLDKEVIRQKTLRCAAHA